MSSRNPFDSRTIIAHITEQQGPQRPREPVEFIPDTFIIQRSETQSGSRESKREALKRLRGSRTEAYGIHKKSLPPLDSLVRPEHILQLVSLPGPSRIQSFHEITKLWQTINSPITTEKDYERAVQKLSNVSSLVKSAIKQGDMERVAIQDFLQNLNLPIGPKACAVCLAPFCNGGKERETTKVEVLAPVSTFPILLPCCHVACYGCMTRWLTERSTCPSCDMRIENVDKIKKAMESRVRRYDDELAEVLDLLKSLASFTDRSNTSRWESADDSMDGKPDLGVLIPDTGKPFIDLRDIPTGRSFCEACGNLFSTTDNLAHYPVRLTCGDIFCYGDVDKWLNVYDLRNCPRCDSPLGDVPLARENIDSQIEHYRRALEVEERLFDLSYNAATLSLQQEELASSGLSSTSAMDEKLGALSDKAAALQLYEWDDDSSSPGTSDEGLLENVVAALSFLDISPSQAAQLDLNDLVDALAVLDLSPGNSATRLMGVLKSMSG